MRDEKKDEYISGWYFAIPILFFSLFTILTILGYHEIAFYITCISIPILFIFLIYFYARRDIDSIKMSLIWGVLGLSMLIFSISADEQKLNQKFISIFLNLGTTLISLSVIGVIFQLKDTKEYFAKTLSELITQDTYISKLSQDQLISLQRKVMEKYFESNGDFNRENSFYHYFSNNIHKYIGMPYRQNLSNNISVNKVGNEYEIIDNISYNIRSMSGNLQDCIKWVTSKNEVQELSSFKIELKGKVIFSWPELEKVNEDNADESISHNFNSVSCFKDGLYFCLSLKDMSAKNTNVRHDYIDNALVKIKAVYKVNDFRSIPVRVLLPTCGFALRVNHSEDLFCKIDSYGMNDAEQSFDCEKSRSGFVLTYKDWLLPESGVYVNIYPVAENGFMDTVSQLEAESFVNSEGDVERNQVAQGA